ncbi:MAG: hypothetical protein KGD63_00915 [Candidatus Lokiarchaeota archaeon]|nr:hypothetical protein [Candidatus Lokiarchaeota archaeon]
MEIKFKLLSKKMPFSDKITILFDLSHNEMLNLCEKEFSDFLSLLEMLNLKIIKNESNEISKGILKNIDILVIGNPINDFFSNIEIENILNYVRTGGSLFLISEYGGDYLQKTNLNDISGNFFNILFEDNIVKDENQRNINCSSILSVNSFPNHKITSQLREIIIGGSCSLLLRDNATTLLKLNDSAWAEKYDDNTNEWEKKTEKNKFIISACSKFGQGKIITLGDIDIFTNDPNIGINKKDNKKFITNIINWLMKPSDESDVIYWTLKRLSSMEKQIKTMGLKISNIIETITILEKRISKIENGVITK